MATNSEVEQGFKLLDSMPRYRRVEANVDLMSHAIHSADTKITPEVLVEIFNRIKPKLATNPDYADALAAFFENHSEYNLEGNIPILEGALSKSGHDVTLSNLEELLLQGNPNNVLNQLAITAEARQAQLEVSETTRMIAEITRYFLAADGKIKREYSLREYNDKIAGLRALSFSDLSARYDHVVSFREQKKAPVEVLRAVVKDAVRQRQYGRYERIPDLYVPPGKENGLKWSFDLFRRLPSTEQRRLLSHFGDAQLTDAMNGNQKQV
jgi:hypothetical protein